MGVSIPAILIAALMNAIVMVPVMNLMVTQAKSRAQLESRLLYEGEVSRARRLWSIDNVDFDTVDLYSSKCAKNSDHGYLVDSSEGFLFSVTCTVGGQSVGSQPVLMAYPEADMNPGQYTDLNGDGFEDKTGLPTHYDQCYSGWKGDGFKATSCEMGGEFVIPMYADLYS